MGLRHSVVDGIQSPPRIGDNIRPLFGIDRLDRYREVPAPVFRPDLQTLIGTSEWKRAVERAIAGQSPLQLNLAAEQSIDLGLIEQSITESYGSDVGISCELYLSNAFGK